MNYKIHEITVKLENYENNLDSQLRLNLQTLNLIF